MNRLMWIDELKGIAIILVVIGHLFWLPSELHQIIYAFHIPIFFFISGFLFRQDKYLNIAMLLQKNTHRLLKPYFIFSTISLLLFVTLFRLFEKDASLFDAIIGIFYSTSSTLHIIHNQPLWFLTCLFVVELIFWLISSVAKSNYSLIVASMIFMTGGFFLNDQYFPLKLPWSIDVALVAAGYYSFGQLARKKLSFFKGNRIFGAILLVLLFSIILKFNIVLAMDSKQYSNPAALALPFFIIYAIVCILKDTRQIKFLCFFGQNTLVILGTHNMIILACRLLFDHLLKLQSNLLMTSLSTVIVLILSALLIKFIAYSKSSLK